MYAVVQTGSRMVKLECGATRSTFPASWACTSRQTTSSQASDQSLQTLIRIPSIASGVREADDLLVELAYARLWNLGDERPVLGHRPLRHPPGQEGLEGFGGDGRARLSDHACKWPLAPFLVGDGDHRALEYLGMRHQGILDLHRGNPFAAGFDHVLGAIGDLDETAIIDRAHVTGAQPPLVESIRRIVP